MGGPLVESLQRARLPVTALWTSNASKTEIVDGLALAFERCGFDILNDAVLLGELKAFEMERLKSGLVRYSAPDGQHDDCVMSLCLAYHAVSNRHEAKGKTMGVWKRAA